MTDTKLAISFQHVSKRYRLGGSSREQFLEAIGIARLFGSRDRPQEFMALDDVSFSLDRGRRMGLIGRNGAGKTTLLKLISGNFRPSEGRVEVGGSVQALMTMGQGFHPEYTGRENIQASLHYNGLFGKQITRAFEDVVEFCELGPFLNQPFKTYSSGMQSRLMFATATAIKPDILVIDEVLGAGDAYFLAKSKRRIDSIVQSGCTLLLVSHAMQQVLELCEEAIWLDGGRIKMRGSAFDVVKSYEEDMYGAVLGSGDPLSTRRTGALSMLARERATSEYASSFIGEQNIYGSDAPGRSLNSHSAGGEEATFHFDRRPNLQTPMFWPHETLPTFRAEIPDADSRKFRAVSKSGVSRWAAEAGLKVVGFSVLGPEGPTETLVTLQPCRFIIFLESDVDGEMACTYGLAIHDLQGRAITRIFSPPDSFIAEKGGGRRVELTLNPNQIGPGVYTIGISIHAASTVEEIGRVPRYDLLSRSFEIRVDLPDTLGNLEAQIIHTGEWSFVSARLSEDGLNEDCLEKMDSTI